MPYVLFMDESGDHNLANVRKDFPVFCLTGCVFEKEYYKQVARPSVEDLKQRFWGRTDVILHSSEIRKQKGAFSFLGDEDKRREFYEAINNLIENLQFTALAAVILKNKHNQRYGDVARNPYHLSLEFMVERYSMFMHRRSRFETGYMMAESRGKNEDAQLKNEFDHYLKFGTRYQNDLGNITNFWMEKKQANIAGLQIADLLAYPIAAKVLRPKAENKAFEIIAPKIDHKPAQNTKILGYGLKIFPSPSWEHTTVFG